MSHNDIYSFELPELDADGNPLKDDTYNIYIRIQLRVISFTIDFDNPSYPVTVT